MSDIIRGRLIYITEKSGTWTTWTVDDIDVEVALGLVLSWRLMDSRTTQMKVKRVEKRKGVSPWHHNQVFYHLYSAISTSMAEQGLKSRQPIHCLGEA